MKPARLRGHDQLDLEPARVLGERAHGMVERPRVHEQRRDVLEDDAGLREVGHVTDVVAQVQRILSYSSKR